MKPSGVKTYSFQFRLKEKEIKNIKCASLFVKKKKKKREAFRVLRDQIERFAKRELEDCNIVVCLKGGEKKKKMLKPSAEKTERFHFSLKEKEIENINRASWFGRKKKWRRSGFCMTK